MVEVDVPLVVMMFVIIVITTQIIIKRINLIVLSLVPVQVVIQLVSQFPVNIVIHFQGLELLVDPVLLLVVHQAVNQAMDQERNGNEGKQTKMMTQCVIPSQCISTTMMTQCVIQYTSTTQTV